MDVFSHGLWAGAAYKTLKTKTGKPLKIWIAAFFGVFPDIFAFTAVFVWFFLNLLSGNISLAEFPKPAEIEPSAPDTLFIFRLTSFLYNLSHSLIIFALTFAVLTVILRPKIQRPPWELGGWLLHIIIDIPTHTYKFYPTPFLWPLSEWKINGVSWAEPYFLATNYLILAAIYFFYLKKTRTGNLKPPDGRIGENKTG